MSWDQPVHSFNFPNGEPQTPTRASTTTTTTAAAAAAFQTPKFESSFFDPRVTWDTSDPYASSPEFLRTPQRFGLATPSNPLRVPDTVHEGHRPAASARNAAVAAVGDTDTAKRLRQLKSNGGGEDEGLRLAHSAKSAASMQTPPPTSASMRKASHDEFAACSARRFSTPSGHLETPSRLLGASPRMLGTLQSSPDLFQLATADPAASPFFAQQIFPWDQDLEQPRLEGGLPTTSIGVFPPQGTFNANPATLNDAQLAQFPVIHGPADFSPYGENAFGFIPPAPADAALFPAPFSTSPRHPVAKADDPALFLSSPARRFGGPPPTPQQLQQLQRQQKGPSRPPRQPYHHQIEESKRDELWRAHRPNGPGPGAGPLERDGADEDDQDEDDYTPRQVRPGLTRSFTHTAVTSSSHRASLNQSSFSGMMASTNGVRKSPTKGRSSPIKNMRPQPLPRANSIATGFPTRSQSVVLKIGKDGRAKTEMRIVSPGATTGLTDPISSMDLDGSATETDSDYSAEYSDYPILHSHNPSFALPDPGLPMLARSESGSRPHSKGSYASSTISSSQSAAGRGSPWAGSSRGAGRRPSLRPSSGDWKKTPKRHSMVINSDFSFGSSVSAASKAGPGSVANEDDSGDAQHALRKVLKGRTRTTSSSTTATTIGYGSRPHRASCSFPHMRSSPPRFGSEPESSTSPTTVTDPDLATPTTDRLRNPSRGTRCVCNSLDNGGHLMIQCESCCHWLHTKCIGLARANLPSSYVCMFCTQTPSRRDRPRKKEPVGSTGHALTSPLAHKSFRSR